jgi:hypothetical protein
MFNAKGMVQYEEATYRIAEISQGRYQAVRVSDDVRMGTFETLPFLRVDAKDLGDGVLRGIARVAFMQGKTRGIKAGVVGESVVKVDTNELAPFEVAAALARHGSARSWYNPLNLSMFAASMWGGMRSNQAALAVS